MSYPTDRSIPATAPRAAAAPRWIGRWIIGVGVFHTVFGSWWFAAPLLRIARGAWSSVGWSGDGRALAFWFIVAGLLSLLVGALADWVEGDGRALPPFFGWGLLLLTVVGCICLPASAFWALLVPAVGAITGTGNARRRTTIHADHSERPTGRSA